MSIEDRQSELCGGYTGLCLLSVLYPAFKITEDTHSEVKRLFDKFAEYYDENEDTSEEEWECLGEIEDICYDLYEEFMTVFCQSDPQFCQTSNMSASVDLLKRLWSELNDLNFEYSDVEEIFMDWDACLDPLQYDSIDDFVSDANNEEILYLNFIRVVTDTFDVEFGE